jgi:hypothetical protein
VNSEVLAHATRNAFLGRLAVGFGAAPLPFAAARELQRHLPVSAITLRNEARQRRAEELGPIEGF